MLRPLPHIPLAGIKVFDQLACFLKTEMKFGVRTKYMPEYTGVRPSPPFLTVSVNARGFNALRCTFPLLLNAQNGRQVIPTIGSYG